LVKISASMLVSRYDNKFIHSIRSVARQQPDSFKVYVDAVKLGDDYEHVCDTISMYGGEPIRQSYDESLSHHMNVVHNVHRAFLESEYRWLVCNDDDDELLSDRRRLIEQHGASDVGVIHGDTVAFQPNKQPWLRRSRQVYQPSQCNYPSMGSGQIYNTIAFKEIHDKVDHGYWWDMKIIYWMMRAGYRCVYVPQLMSIQNVNTSPSEKRLDERRRGWRVTLDSLEQEKF